jgi:hypothetical protein
MVTWLCAVALEPVCVTFELECMALLTGAADATPAPMASALVAKAATTTALETTVGMLEFGTYPPSFDLLYVAVYSVLVDSK